MSFFFFLTPFPADRECTVSIWYLRVRHFSSGVFAGIRFLGSSFLVLSYIGDKNGKKRLRLVCRDFINFLTCRALSMFCFWMQLLQPSMALDLKKSLNLNGWEFMVPLGLNAAISVKFSNELGAGHPSAAKFSILVVTVTSLLIGFAISIMVFFTIDLFPTLFTNSEAVMEAVKKLASLLCVTIFLNSTQPVLPSLAIGAGWQAFAAYVNIGCYYLFGILLGYIFGFYFNFGTQGIWIGMIGRTTLQTLILVIVTFKTDWTKEVKQVGSSGLFGMKIDMLMYVL